MSNSRKYTVIFRACDIINAVNKNPRPFDLGKAELIKICFLSLVESLRDLDYQIIVLGDKLSENMIEFFRNQRVQLNLGTYGNDASIRETVTIAQSVPDDHWIYFCEDDYLHHPECFSRIDNFLDEADVQLKVPSKPYNMSSWVNLKRKDLFVFPPDYPDRYSPKLRKHSLILLSRDCHWRQVGNITFTFLTKATTAKKYASLITRASHHANDRMLSRKLFGRIGFGFLSPGICFSPIPGLSTHMHRDTMTPQVDWESLAERYRKQLSLMDGFATNPSLP